MREFAKFVTGFWTSSTIQSLTDSGKLLAAYLITSPHSNQPGIFRIPTGYVEGDIGWSSERVNEGFDELSRKGFATRCNSTFWVVIHKALKHTPPENPNQIKHVRTLIEQVPLNASIRTLIAQSLSENWQTVPEDLIAWLSKPLANPSATLPEQREGEGEGDKKEKESTDAGGSRPAATPKEKVEPPTRSTWNAYRESYEKRYGVQPVCNASVRGKLSNFVTRIPADEAPKVAAFYVETNRQLYINAKHCVDLLVRDAESLRTEWATGGKSVAAPLNATSEWWRTADGIKAKGMELQIEAGDIVELKARIAARLGDGPWVDDRNVTERRLIEQYRDEGQSA